MENKSKTYRDGNIVVKISGSRSDKLDWKSRLIDELADTVGYYREPSNTWTRINEKMLNYLDPNDVVTEAVEESEIKYNYDLIVAVPHIEDSIFMLSYLMQQLEKEPEKILFTYLPSYDEEYSKDEIECLEQIGSIVKKKGGRFFRTKNLYTLAGSLEALSWI